MFWGNCVEKHSIFSFSDEEWYVDVVSLQSGRCAEIAHKPWNQNRSSLGLCIDSNTKSIGFQNMNFIVESHNKLECFSPLFFFFWSSVVADF